MRSFFLPSNRFFYFSQQTTKLNESTHLISSSNPFPPCCLIGNRCKHSIPTLWLKQSNPAPSLFHFHHQHNTSHPHPIVYLSNTLNIVTWSPIRRDTSDRLHNSSREHSMCIVPNDRLRSSCVVPDASTSVLYPFFCKNGLLPLKWCFPPSECLHHYPFNPFTIQTTLYREHSPQSLLCHSQPQMIAQETKEYGNSNTSLYNSPEATTDSEFGSKWDLPSINHSSTIWIP